jgi:sulfur relay (sulfurtransferase) DsrC/TusE family protein
MSFDINGKTYETDEEGYLVNLSDWDTDAAAHIAEEEKVPLTDNHWEVINFLREYYNEYQRQQQVPVRPVPLRPGQAGLQDRRPPETDRLRLTSLTPQ